MITTDVERIGSLVRAELGSRTGIPPTELGDATSLDDVGIDSLALIDVLMSLQEQVLEEQGLSIGDTDEADSLPWMETVGDLVVFATSFIPTAEAPVLVGAVPSSPSG